MSNGFAASFNNRDASSAPLDTTAAQTGLFANTYKGNFSGFRVYHENSMTTQLLPPLSVSGNEARAYVKEPIAEKPLTAKVEKHQPLEKTETTNKLSRTQQIMKELYAGVDRIRKQHGLDSLTPSEKLEKMALVNSKKMKSRNSVGHFAGYQVRENAAMAPIKSNETPEKIANRILAMWMNSSGHRANLLNDRITKMGAGVDGKWDTLSLA